MNKYYNINNLFDENGEPVKVTIKIKRKYNYIDYKTAYETILDSNKFLFEKYNELQKQNDDLMKENNKLQSNWNSLREWLKEYSQDLEFRCYMDMVLDKMNELEGKDKE